MSAKIQVLADSGMEGSKMGTQLKIIYSKLAKSGLTWDEAMGKIQGSTNKIATASKLFGENAFNAAIILSENTVKLDKYSEANMGAAGTSKKLADIMDSGIGGAMRRMKSQLEGVAIELGEQLIPIFTKVIEKVEKVVKWFTSLSDEQKKSIVKWGLVIAAIGPALIIIGKMSVGLGSLVGALKTVGKFLIANPYVALAAAIGIIVVSLTDWADGLFGVSGAQKTVNDINSTAAKAISDQKTEVDLLTATLKDENATLKEKETALKELNKISPEYYGKLTAAKTDVEALDIATQNYTTSILQQAKAEAALSKLKDLNAQMLEVELNAKGDLFGATTLLKEKIQEEIDAVMKLVKENKKLSSTSREVVEENKNLGNSLGDAGDDTEDLTTKVGGLGAAIGKIMEGDKFSSIEDQFKGLVFWTTELTQEQKMLNGAFGLFGDIVATSMTSALEGSGNFFDSFVKGVTSAIKKLLIQLGVMLAIDVLLGGKNLTKALLMTRISEIIPMADGGIVTGPQLSLIGEAGPEAVIPLDKMDSVMGGGSQNVTVTGRLVGNDIYLSNERTKFNRNRTV